MAPLALYLQGAGIQVEAYDDRFAEPLRSRLLGEGIEVLGEPMPTGEPDCVIRSSAVAEAGSQATPGSRKASPFTVVENFWPSSRPAEKPWLLSEVMERRPPRGCSCGPWNKSVFPVPIWSEAVFGTNLCPLESSCANRGSFSKWTKATEQSKPFHPPRPSL